MTTWYISDTHWSHKNIIKYSNRPFASVAEMNEKLIENWNRAVKPTDNVWHLGDFAFAKIDEIKTILGRLNGFKNFIFGNHDKEIMHYRNELIDRNLFNSINNYVEFPYNNEFIVLLHYGMRVWNRSHRGSIQLFGHSHGNLPPFGKSCDVGVDAPFIIPRVTPEDYRPVSMEEVLAFMATRSIKVVDHHAPDR